LSPAWVSDRLSSRDIGSNPWDSVAQTLSAGSSGPEMAIRRPHMRIGAPRVTSSELSMRSQGSDYRDHLGGNVETGRRRFGFYREPYDVPGQCALLDISGTRVRDNQLSGCAWQQWMLFARPEMRDRCRVKVLFFFHTGTISATSQLHLRQRRLTTARQSYVSVRCRSSLRPSRPRTPGWNYKHRVAPFLQREQG